MEARSSALGTRPAYLPLLLLERREALGAADLLAENAGRISRPTFFQRGYDRQSNGQRRERSRTRDLFRENSPGRTENRRGGSASSLRCAHRLPSPGGTPPPPFRGWFVMDVGCVRSRAPWLNESERELGNRSSEGSTFFCDSPSITRPRTLQRRTTRIFFPNRLPLPLSVSLH